MLPTYEEEASDFAYAVVTAVSDIRDRLLRLRALMAEDTTNPEDPRDATSFAGHLAAALLALGGRLPDGNPNRLRFPIAEQPYATRDPRGIGGTRLLLGTVVDCLAKGDMSSTPDAILMAVAEIWPAHRNKPSAERARRENEAKVAEIDGQAAVRAHEARLAAVKKVPARPTASDQAAMLGSGDMPAVMATRRYLSPNEWLEGEDIGQGAPRVG